MQINLFLYIRVAIKYEQAFSTLGTERREGHLYVIGSLG